MNRTQMPSLRAFPPLQIPQPQRLEWANGIKLCLIEADSVPVLRIEWVMPKHGVAPHYRIGAFLRMLQEGAGEYHSADIAAIFDNYGAHFQVDEGLDYLHITLFTLNKYLTNLIPVLRAIFFEPHFPEADLEIEKNQMLQNHRYNQEKVAYLARIGFMKQLFPEGHPYRPLDDEQQILGLNNIELKQAYKELMLTEGTWLFIAGNGCENAARMLEEAFGHKMLNNKPLVSPYSSNLVTNPKRILLHKKQAIQTAIRMGLPTIGRNHPDYIDLKITNTLLGGYFGSKLMQSIRETKGYSYGIGSSIQSQSLGAWFTLATEVNAEVTEDAVQTILSDMQDMADKLMDMEVIENMKKYLEGNIFSSFDGAFALADRQKDVLLDGADASYYHQFLERLKTITAIDLQQKAAQYLNPKGAIIVLAGNFDNA